MFNKKIIIFSSITLWFLLNITFAYPKLSESDHQFIDKSLSVYHNASKEEKKQKSQLYSKVANDAKVLRNAYLWAYTWSKLKWEILNEEAIKNWVNQYTS